ncbi:MAG: hypothetical protein ACI4MG_06845, partial [Aristaeellaceae bacterium]
MQHFIENWYEQSRADGRADSKAGEGEAVFMLGEEAFHLGNAGMACCPPSEGRAEQPVILSNTWGIAACHSR